MAKPTNLPTWDSNETNIVQPDSARQDDGWLAPGGIPEKPAFQFFNWWQNNVYKWLNEINIKGILQYDSATDYIANLSYAVGSDGNMYHCLINNGVSSTPVNPVGDVTGTWAIAFLSGDTVTSIVGSEIRLTFAPTEAQKLAMRAIEADGSLLLDSEYPDLLTAMGGKIYGGTSDSFYILNASGRVSRARDHGAGVDPDAASRQDRGDGTTGDVVGTLQPCATHGHIHYAGIADKNDEIGVYGSTSDDLPGFATRQVTDGEDSILVQQITSTPKTATGYGDVNLSTEARMINYYSWVGIHY